MGSIFVMVEATCSASRHVLDAAGKDLQNTGHRKRSLLSDHI
jgi:hypothetical protein